jgi:hypothetical protein
MVISVATLFTLLFGLTYWLGGSKIAEHREMREQKERLSRQIELNRRILDEKEKWTGRLAELQEQLPVYDRKVYITGEIQKQIKRIADKNKLDFTKSRSDSEKRVGSLYELSVVCDWEGGLDALVHFLYEINEEGLRYDVRELSVRPDAKRAGILRGDMTIACAYRRADETTPDE